MDDINVRDSLYNSIGEYNNMILKKNNSDFTDKERTGMFYTCLRRNFDLGNPNRYGSLSTDNLECTFREDGQLKSFVINKHSLSRDYHNWVYAEETLNKRVFTLFKIKEIGSERKEFYRTPIMNEIADIVNKVKL